MATFQFPWYRVIVFTLLIAALAWWIHYRDFRLVGEEPVPGPAPGIARPEAEALPVVALYVLPHAVSEGEAPMYWLRVGNVAFDVQLPGPEAEAEAEAEADPELWRRVREVRETALEMLGEELEDLRREADDPATLVGEVRRGASIPSSLYMEAFQLFIEAGYGKVNMVLTEARPPGRPPR